MPNNQCRELGFSEAFVAVKYIEDMEEFAIDHKSIILNLSDRELTIAGNSLKPMTSSVYSSIVIPQVSKAVCITLDKDYLSLADFPYDTKALQAWAHVYDIFNLEHLRDTKLWRSEKERVGSIEFNLWYAAAGTNCGIHNEHDFKELHTQVFGIGRMQKFHTRESSTLYQEVYMSPGYTHDPFYDNDCVYPWHQYYADTDCLWLAVEFHTR